MRRALLLLLVLLPTACGPGDGSIDRTVDLRVSGDDRTFDLFVPAGLSGPVPLLVVFHGFTSTPAEIRRATGFDAVARQQGWAVAYPRALGLIPAWREDPMRGEADLEFVVALVEAVERVVAIDREAVFLAGFSNGGGMAVRIACESSLAVAGVAVVAAAVTPPGCSPPGAVPLIVIHGGADRIVPPDGEPGRLAAVADWAGAWAEAAGCGTAAEASVLAVGLEVVRWPGCEGRLEWYQVDDWGHAWPGDPAVPGAAAPAPILSASDLIGRFFAGL